MGIVAEPTESTAVDTPIVEPATRRPGLDGLRAIAVLAVVVYHADPDVLPGGFVGVDLFFVLSGYLITTLLIGEHDRSGRVSLRAFWGRRARRLWPLAWCTLAAIAAKKTIALASKEILVLAGKFVMAAAKASGSRLLPVDSEHNAVFQCLEGHRAADVRRLVLTASGGAFRDWPLERLAQVTPADALKHPNWAMGPKITVDSATLANKGLELIEAQWLFGLRAEQCQAVLHAQSIMHCLVEFTDGSLLAQLCPPSMTFPIQHCLLYPERARAGTDAALSLDRVFALDFRPVDEARYPCLRLARESMAAGGTAPAVFNAANEVAVAAFLKKQVPYLAIPRIIEKTLGAIELIEPSTLDQVLAVDAAARRVAATFTHQS